MSSTRHGRFWPEALGALGAVALVAVLYALGGLDRILANIAPAEARAAPAAAAIANCRMPAEHEQLHVVIAWRDAHLAAQCMYVGSTGTYTGRRP